MTDIPCVIFVRTQATSKGGEEHLSDDDDLQGIVARSQVPLRGRRCYHRRGQQESADFTLPEDTGFEEATVSCGIKHKQATFFKNTYLSCCGFGLMSKSGSRLFLRTFSTVEVMSLKSDTISSTVTSASAHHRLVSTWR